jgi:hypothetical protein
VSGGANEGGVEGHGERGREAACGNEWEQMSNIKTRIKVKWSDREARPRFFLISCASWRDITAC